MSLLDEFQAMQQAALDELALADTTDGLEAWRIKYVGSKGSAKDAMTRLKQAPS